MKPNIFRYFRPAALLAVAVAGFALASCEDEPDRYRMTDGVPTVHYIRPVNVEASDSLLTGAYMENMICMVGENLRSIYELWFNDQKAILNTSYMTDNTLIVTVPSTIPALVTDKIYMVTSAKDTVTYDFNVLVPGPVISSMLCEYVPAGEEAVIYGDYFIDDPNVPLEITFAGDVKATHIKSITKNALTFVVPEGAQEGPIEISTIYGDAESVFHYWDHRGIITDFDGTTDVVPQGWNIKATYDTADGVEGQYVVLGPSELNENADWNEALKLPFWCGNWNGDPMSITSGPGVPICNFIDFTDFANMAIKFELCIPKSNPWSSGAMQIVFTSADVCANDTWQNNNYIHTSASGGLDLCRGLYRPWVSNGGSFDTDDKWITVTVPFADFKYNADGTEGLVPLTSPSDFASLIIWPWSGGVQGVECNPVFKIDNIRAVPNR